MLSFGQRLKLIRKEAQVTQAELAEKLMVSVQAISKWECDTSMPDISLLVPLAAILGVTTDCLLGVGGDEKADREKFYCEYEKLESEIKYGVYSAENNAIYRSYELTKEYLKKYPLDYEVKYLCAQSALDYIGQAKRYNYSPSKDEEDALYNEAIMHLTAIINYDKDATRLIGARELLILIYLWREDYSNAESVVVCLPHRGSIRAEWELQIADKKKEYDKCLEIASSICNEAVAHYLSALWIRARRISILGNDRKKEAISAWYDLLEAAKNNYRVFNDRDIIDWWYSALNRISNDYIAISEFDKAFETIEELTDTIIMHYNEYKEKGDTEALEEMKSDFWFYMHWCYNKCFPTSDNIIANDPRFKKCEERLAALD